MLEIFLTLVPCSNATREEYPHMLLLSWIALGGGRGVVTLDSLNCTEVRLVPSPTHSNAREDVGTIAARTQVVEGQGPDLMELLCPFQLLYTNSVERLAAESARKRVRWVSAVWKALDRSFTLPKCSKPGSPRGSIRTIHLITNASTCGSTSCSAFTVFAPLLHIIPSVSDLSDRMMVPYPAIHMCTQATPSYCSKSK
ncbi:hypothetical protein EV401DRAFT_628055 [Pisolithus croceorrhizus]|nr:hypothetical protein EV401DRAFT_628055 [Pisolithus croceorrhizus]